MLSERKQEQIRQLFEEGENISEIARKVNVDRKTVRLYIDRKYTTQEPQNMDLKITEGRQDAIVQDTSEKEIEVMQDLFQYSPDDLERAKEILMNEKKDEIIKEFWEDTVGPLFAKGEYLTGDRHGEIIRILMEKHQNKIYKLNRGYQQEKTNFTYEIQTLRNGNLRLKEINGELHDYIGNYLDAAGRLESRRLEEERGGFIVEKTEFIAKETEFKQYIWEKETYFRGREEDLNNKFREADDKLKEAVKQKEELDEREKGLNMFKNEIIKQQNKSKENLSSANRVLSEIKWRQDFLNNTREIARREKIKIPSHFPPQSKEENKKQLQSEEEMNKLIRDAIGPKTVKMVPA